MTGLRISTGCDESCFELPEWSRLLARDPNRHVFATPEWNRLWWEEFGSGKDLLLLTMTRGDDVAAIVPLYRRHEADDRKVLRFLGGIQLTDYLGPVCSKVDREDVADALVGWLLTTDFCWDELDAHNMPVPLGFGEFLVERSDRAGLEFRLEQEETSAVLPVERDWDGYLASLGSKPRHEVKRKMRRLWREHPDAVVRAATAGSLEVDLATFVGMHRGAEGHKGHFMRPDIASFFVRVAHAFMELGWLRLHILEIGGRPVASTFAFEFDGRFYLYNSAYEPDARQLSPGFVLVAELVKRSIEAGLELFDFLRGPERYKYQLGAQAVPLNNVRVLKRGTG